VAKEVKEGELAFADHDIIDERILQDPMRHGGGMNTAEYDRSVCLFSDRAGDAKTPLVVAGIG